MSVKFNLLTERRVVKIRGTLFKSVKDLVAVMRVEKALAQLLALLEAERLFATYSALPTKSGAQSGKELIVGAQLPGKVPQLSSACGRGFHFAHLLEFIPQLLRKR